GTEQTGNAKSTRSIPIVRTYGDLLREPFIDLGNGTRVRVGIEACNVSVGSGALLYCLAEGYVPQIPAAPTGYPFGPLEIAGLPAGKGRWSEGPLTPVYRDEELRNSKLLFAGPIVGVKPGDLEISVLAASRALAR